MRWCGVDIGSTNIKVIAVDRTGAVCGSVERPTPRTADERWLVTDADVLLDVVEELILEAVQGEAVVAVCVAGMGEDGVFVDGDGRTLGLVLPWFDLRRREVLPELVERFGSARGEFGVELDATRTLTAWAWLGRRHPEQLSGAATWVALADYPALRWTGTPVMTDNLAVRTAAWTIDSGWVQERVTPFLGSAFKLPDVIGAGTVVGPLRSKRLAEAGALAPGAVVVTGGHDHPVAGSVVHRADPGAVLDSMGTVEMVVKTVAAQDVVLGCDVSPAVACDGRTLTKVLDLDRNVRAARARSPEVAREIDRMLAEGIPRVEGGSWFRAAVPGGRAPEWSKDADAVGTVGLAADALNACAQLGAKAVDGFTDGSARDVHAAGGWTRSVGWMNLKSAVLGRDYRISPEIHLTALGAAQLGMISTAATPDDDAFAGS